MTKHTPGTWRVIESDPLDICAIDGLRVATLRGPDGDMPIEQVDANAWLIAAAPALYDALAALVTVATPDADPLVMFVTIEHARAALALADGEV